MNFDVVIIGGGLAGLTCGIALQQQGKQCAIINNGQAAIDFSSGSMDLLASGQNSADFCNLPAVHPYAILGEAQVRHQAQRFEQLASDLKLGLHGTTGQNHWRVTPLGSLRPTWLSPKSMPTVSDKPFEYQRISVLGIEGYHDFQPQLLADNLRLQPAFQQCEFSVDYLNIPQLDQLRQQSREFRSVNIAQLLEHQLSFAELVSEIQQHSGNAEAIFLPACFGLDNFAFFDRLQQAVGVALFELPTLPPSLIGIRQHKALRQRFEQLGGLMFNGDRALKAEFDGNRVTKIYTQIHGNNAISATHFVLASGSFFSNGLVAHFEQIVEPLFGADLVGCNDFAEKDRLSWTAERFATAQPYQSAGVVINAQCQVRKNGEFLTNVYAVGNIIGGYDGISQGCGSGVAVVTALTVADQIIGGTAQ